MLAIVGGKGGCGKTTTALGLARAFAAAGERPLVVDADRDMPDVHTLADVDRTPGLDALADGASLGRCVRRSGAFPGVDVVPAGRAAGAVDSRALRRLRRARGRVVVDCPAGATEAVATPLRAADAALAVATPDRPTLVDAAKTVRMARALDARVPGAVVTRAADGGGGTHGDGTRGDDPLRAECAVLAAVPERDRTPGAERVLSNPVVRSSYERLVRTLHERNI